MRANQKPRRRYSDDFKAQVVAACAEPEASVSAVALSFGLNANLVRQWQRGRGYTASGTPAAQATAAPQFVALSLPAPALPAPSAGVRAAAPEAIRVELKRGTLAVSVSWPASAAAECAALLRELLR